MIDKLLNKVLKCSGIYKRSHNSSIGQTETFMAGPGVHSLATLYQVAWIKHPWDAYNDMNASSFSYYALIYDDLMVLEDIRCLALEKV
ncbi:uncharacterized protein LOC113333715 isoform X2 [Papaver somniferum]|nr:uncharacterized protein LOC113333715 isoform X2 [Papaver somniferum]